MFHCRECKYVCKDQEVRCPFYQGRFDQLEIDEIEGQAKAENQAALIYLATCRILEKRGMKKPSAGISALKKLAKKNNFAKGFLGLCYLKGLGVSVKPEKGFTLLKEGSYHLGCHQMEKEMSQCYENGTGTPKDYEKAKEYRRYAAGRGNLQLLMAVAEEQAGGTQYDIQRAIEDYRLAAKWDLPGSREKLRTLCKHNKRLAVSAMGLAIDGNINAMIQVGQFYLNDSVLYDPAEALKWYQAVALRSEKAALELAKLYLEGKHWPRDPGLAVWYLMQTYENEEADTMRCQLEEELAANLENEAYFQTPAQKTWFATRLLKTDPQRAKLLLEESARQNCPWAAETLGVAYYEGQFGQVSRSTAFSYFNQAYNHFSFTEQKERTKVRLGYGSRLAGAYLARCYYNGYGTQQNKQQAEEILLEIFELKKLDRTWIQIWRCSFAFTKIREGKYPESLVSSVNLLGNCAFAKEQYFLAYELFSSAVAKGLGEAHHNVALCCEKGAAGPVDAEEIFAHYKAAAEAGVLASIYKVGLCYLEGKGTQRNPQEAVRLLGLAADRGDVAAMEKMGDCHLDGIMQNATIAEAVAWYQKAAASGLDVTGKLLRCLQLDPTVSVQEPAVCAKMGDRYYKEKNYDEAVKWLQKAETQPQAATLLADCYYYGRGVAKNEAETFRLYTVGAKAGIAAAQYGLGLCYYYGKSVTVDLQKAAQLFLQAAEKGNAEAQMMCGVCCYLANGVQKDYQQAHKWFELAAKKGELNAIRNLGVMYENGNGVQKDPYTAMAYYKSAEKLGMKRAVEDIARMKKTMEEVRKKQSPQAPANTEPVYTASSWSPNYDPSPLAGLPQDGSIVYVNRNLQTDLSLCCSEEERQNVLKRYQYTYPDIPLYENDTSYSYSEPLDDHDYLELLNDIM